MCGCWFWSAELCHHLDMHSLERGRNEAKGPFFSHSCFNDLMEATYFWAVANYWCTCGSALCGGSQNVSSSLPTSSLSLETQGPKFAEIPQAISVLSLSSAQLIDTLCVPRGHKNILELGDHTSKMGPFPKHFPTAGAAVELGEVFPVQHPGGDGSHLQDRIPWCHCGCPALL